MSINLSHPTEDKQSTFHKKKPIIDVGIMISFAVAIITLSFFGGLKFYNSSLSKKIETFKQEIGSQSMNLVGKPDKSADVDRVADFAQRLNFIAGNTGGKINPGDPLTWLEETMISGATLETYAYDNSKMSVSIAAVADGFPTVARQLLSFKKSSHFQNVKISGISKKDKAMIGFSIDMNIVK